MCWRFSGALRRRIIYGVIIMWLITRNIGCIWNNEIILWRRYFWLAPAECKGKTTSWLSRSTNSFSCIPFFCIKFCLLRCNCWLNNLWFLDVPLYILVLLLRTRRQFLLHFGIILRWAIEVPIFSWDKWSIRHHRFIDFLNHKIIIIFICSLILPDNVLLIIWD